MLNTIFAIIGGICIALLIWAFIKFKSLRIFIGCAILALLVFTGFISGVRLNQYYNASGGVIGQITGVYNPNIVESNFDGEFNIKDVNFVKNETTGKYEIVIFDENSTSLNENEFYIVKVNDEPCQILYSSKDAVQAKYTYLFQGNNLVGDTYEELAVDTMTINFAFYGNYSKLIIEIDGGLDTAPLWESFFEKNNFQIKIEAVSDVEIVSANLKTVTILANDEIYQKIKIKAGSDYILPTTCNIDGFTFNGFTVNGETVDKLTNINSDVTVVASLIKACTVTVSANIDGQDINSNFLGKYKIPIKTTIEEFTNEIQNNNSFIFYLSTRTPSGFEFLGFTTKQGFTTDSTAIEKDFEINEDVTLYVVWQAISYDVEVISNDCNYKIGNLELSNDFELKSPYNYLLTLSFINSNIENKVFDNYKFYFSNYPNKTMTVTASETNFSIMGMYNSLFNYYGNEYVPEEDRIYFEQVGYLIIEIYTKDYQEDWTEKYSEEELAEIINFEQSIADYFGISYVDGGDNITYPIGDENTYLKHLYHGLTKLDTTNMTNLEIENNLMSLFETGIQYEKEPHFLEFLTQFWNVIQEFEI